MLTEDTGAIICDAESSPFGGLLPQVSADPLGLAAGQSIYGYVGGVPANRIDMSLIRHISACCMNFRLWPRN